MQLVITCWLAAVSHDTRSSRLKTERPGNAKEWCLNVVLQNGNRNFFCPLLYPPRNKLTRKFTELCTSRYQILKAWKNVLHLKHELDKLITEINNCHWPVDLWAKLSITISIQNNHLKTTSQQILSLTYLEIRTIPQAQKKESLRVKL